MTATRNNVDKWIEIGKEKRSRWILSMCDTYDYEDYPIYVDSSENIKTVIKFNQTQSMQKINEIISIDHEGVVIENLNVDYFKD